MDLDATTACRFPGNIRALLAAVKAGFAVTVIIKHRFSQ